VISYRRRGVDEEGVVRKSKQFSVGDAMVVIRDSVEPVGVLC
jgi:hypothetical protein